MVEIDQDKPPLGLLPTHLCRCLADGSKGLLGVILILNLHVWSGGCGQRAVAPILSGDVLRIPLTASHPLKQVLSGSSFEEALGIELHPAEGSFRFLFPNQSTQMTGEFARLGSQIAITQFSIAADGRAAIIRLDPVSKQVRLITTSEGVQWKPSVEYPARTDRNTAHGVDAYLASNLELLEIEQQLAENADSARTNHVIVFLALLWLGVAAVPVIPSICAVLAAIHELLWAMIAGQGPTDENESGDEDGASDSDGNQRGACCYRDGACTFGFEASCLNTGGAYQGDNVNCAAANCPQPGACCRPDGSCTLAAEIGGGDCSAAGGAYQGDDTTCAPNPCPPTAKLEAGTILVGETHVTAQLSNTYVNPIVVCSVQYANNTSPVVDRVSNLTANSFDIRLQNPSGNPLAAEQVSYLVMEEGVWTLDSINCEAQLYLASVTDEDDSWVGEAQTYGQSYTNPVVIGQVMSENDFQWSVFWCQGDSRTDPPSASTLRTGKTVCEDTNVTRADETVGCIVFEAGHGTIGGIEFEALLGADTVQGIDDTPPYSYSFSAAFASAPQVAVTTMAAVDGFNGAWSQTHGFTQATTTTLFVSLDEDQIEDSERNHVTEQVGYVVFESPVVYP